MAQKNGTGAFLKRTCPVICDLITGHGVGFTPELSDESVRVWDADTGVRLGGATTHNAVDSICVNPSGTLMAVGGKGYRGAREMMRAHAHGSVLGGYFNWEVAVVSLPNCKPGKPIRHADTRGPHRLWPHQFISDELLLVSAESDLRGEPAKRRVGLTSYVHQLFVFNVRTTEWHDFAVGSNPGDVWTLAVDPSHEFVAAGLGLGDDVIVIRSLRTRKVIKVLSGHDNSVKHVCFSPDGKYLASASYDSTVRLWDTKTWLEVASLSMEPAANDQGDRYHAQYCCAFSPDSQTLVATQGWRSGRRVPTQIILLEVPSFNKLLELDGCPRKPDHFMFNATGTAILTGAIEGRGLVQVRSASNGKLLSSFDNSYIGKFDPLGRRLFVARSHQGDANDSPLLRILGAELLDWFLSTPSQIRVAARSRLTPLQELEQRVLSLAERLMAGNAA